MNARVEQLISSLQLQPHPEGGYYREVYRSSEKIQKGHLPPRFSGDCAISTSIYYLLGENDFSAFHRIRSDEIWHFYDGGTLLIYIVDADGTLKIEKLGRNSANDEQYQVIVPAMSWFAAIPEKNSGFVLAGCTVAPGFNFSDFEMAIFDNLVGKYPSHYSLFRKLCRK